MIWSTARLVASTVSENVKLSTPSSTSSENITSSGSVLSGYTTLALTESGILYGTPDMSSTAPSWRNSHVSFSCVPRSSICFTVFRSSTVILRIIISEFIIECVPPIML